MMRSRLRARLVGDSCGWLSWKAGCGRWPGRCWRQSAGRPGRWSARLRPRAFANCTRKTEAMRAGWPLKLGGGLRRAARAGSGARRSCRPFGDLQRLDPVVKLCVCDASRPARQARAPGSESGRGSAALRCGVSFPFLLALLQCQRAGPFNPVAIDVLDQFAQFGLVLGDQVITPKFGPMVRPSPDGHGPRLEPAHGVVPASARPPSAARFGREGLERLAAASRSGRSASLAVRRHRDIHARTAEDRLPAFLHMTTATWRNSGRGPHRACMVLPARHPGPRGRPGHPGTAGRQYTGADQHGPCSSICSPASRPARALLREPLPRRVAVVTALACN